MVTTENSKLVKTLSKYFTNLLDIFLDTVSKSKFYLILPIAFYLFFSIGLTLTRTPLPDELFQPNAAVNLIKYGIMGVIEADTSFATTWKGIDKRYFNSPPSILAQAFCYKLFGIGLFQLRAIAVFFGLIGLLSWAIILKQLKVEKKIILLATILISIDFIYTRFSAHGRLFDIMSAAFAFASWASYLSLREKSLPIALLVSNTLIVLSGLTHINGILGWVGLLFLILYHDRQKLQLRYILLSLIPYFVGGIAWGYYILQDPEAFYYQYIVTILVEFESHTHKGIEYNFWKFIYSEIKQRYLYSYGFSSEFPRYVRGLLFILIVYFCSFITLGSKLKTDYASRIVFVLTSIYFFLLMFLNPHKWTIYLCHIIPLYASCVAVFYSHLKEKPVLKQLLTISIVIVLVLSTGVNVHRFIRNDYHKEFLPEVKKIQQFLTPGYKIFSPQELSFHLGFENIFIDPALGYNSKRQADFVILKDDQENVLETILKATDPKMADYVQKLLNNDYHLIYKGKLYKLYKKV